jgi:hypothetical protein
LKISIWKLHELDLWELFQTNEREREKLLLSKSVSCELWKRNLSKEYGMEVLQTASNTLNMRVGKYSFHFYLNNSNFTVADVHVYVKLWHAIRQDAVDVMFVCLFASLACHIWNFIYEKIIIIFVCKTKQNFIESRQQQKKYVMLIWSSRKMMNLCSKRVTRE